MASEYHSRQLIGDIGVNPTTWAMLVISVAVHGVALFFNDGSVPAGAPKETMTSFGEIVSWVPRIMAMVIGFALIVLALSKLSSLVPEVIKSIVVWLLIFFSLAALAWVVYMMVVNGNFLLLGGMVAYFVIAISTGALRLQWVVRDVSIIAAGGFIVSRVGSAFSPAMLAVLIGAFAVWDHIAVHESDVMEGLGQTVVGKMQTIVIPTTLRPEYSMDDIFGNELPDDIGMVIGLGDFAIPAVLTIAAWNSAAPITAVGVFAGIIVGILYASTRRTDGIVAGIPILGGPAVAGWALVALPVWLVSLI